MTINAQDLLAEAKKEVDEEMSKATKSKLKKKIGEIRTAENILENLKQELDVLAADL